MRDRSPIWIGLADLMLCVVSVVITAVAPVKSKTNGVEMKALYLLTLEWDTGIDADVDIHMLPPRGEPTFYRSRDVGCATLDRDNRGFMDTMIKLPDGSSTKVMSNKETIAIRCVEPGRYDVAANLYAYRINNRLQGERHDLGLKVHAEIVRLNPEVEPVFAKDVTLDWIGETINVASFDMGHDASISLVDPPLEPITAKYQQRKAERPKP